MLRWCQPLVTYGVAMSIRFERRPVGGERLRIIAGITVGSFLAGLGVALVAAIVAFNTHQCAPDLSDDECGTFLLGFGVFLVTLAITPVIAMPVLAWLTQMGAVFTTAATVAMALIGWLLPGPRATALPTRRRRTRRGRIARQPRTRAVLSDANQSTQYAEVGRRGCGSCGCRVGDSVGAGAQPSPQ